MNIKTFTDLYDTEKQARDMYNKMLDKIKDKRITEKITSIRNDEIKHMQIAQKIIELVGTNKPEYTGLKDMGKQYFK